VTDVTAIDIVDTGVDELCIIFTPSDVHLMSSLAPIISHVHSTCVRHPQSSAQQKGN